MLFKTDDAMQLDWELEVIEITGVEQRIKVAHFFIT